MAESLTIGTASGNKEATEIWVGTSSGNKQVTEGWVGTAGGNEQFYALLPPLTADASPNSQSWVGAPLAYFTFNDLVCTAGGGSGVYTYAWEVVSGTATVGSPTAATSEAQSVTNSTCTFRCLVSDDAGSTPVYSDTISVDP